jgi:hypothetical protein
MKSYPQIAAFFGAWLHQDFDLVGETLADVVTAYLEVSSQNETGALRKEIQALLRDTTGDFDQAVVALFHPEVYLDHFAPNSREFFQQLDKLLQR